MFSYFFILGNNPALSVAEILNKFQPKKYSLINKEVFRVEFEKKIDEQKVIKKLGGTVKLAMIKEPVSAEATPRQAISNEITNNKLQITRLAKATPRRANKLQNSKVQTSIKEKNHKPQNFSFGKDSKGQAMGNKIPAEPRKNSEELLGAVEKYLPEKFEGKYKFGFSFYGESSSRGGYSKNSHGEEFNLKKLAMDIKRELKAREISCRWITSKGNNLSSVVVAKNKMIDRGQEFIVVTGQGKKYLGITKAVQDFEELSFRDYNRPARDSQSGMIPPKLAQMMLNIGLQGRVTIPDYPSYDKAIISAKSSKNFITLAEARASKIISQGDSAGVKNLSQNSDLSLQKDNTKQSPTDQVLLDPFCGSGTILMEAMLLGVQDVIGVDVSEKAVKNTRKNLEWVQERFNLSKKNSFEVRVGNAVKLAGIIKEGSVDVIVTEPYLGPQKKAGNIEKVKKDLEVLYTGAIREFRKILKPGGRVVMVWPVLRGAKNSFMNPKIEGFKIVSQIPGDLKGVESTDRGTIVYGRRGQRVWREITTLEKAS